MIDPVGAPQTGPEQTGPEQPGPEQPGPGAADAGPHPRTLRWVEEVTGARVVGVQRLRGGLTSRVHGVTVRLSATGPGPDRTDVLRPAVRASALRPSPVRLPAHPVAHRSGVLELVLREVADPTVGDEAVQMVRREAAALRRLLHSAVPAPGLVAADPEARRTGHPSLLMTLLPGALRLDSEGLGERLGALATAASAVHRLSVPPGGRPRPWTSWVDPTGTDPPAWAADAGVFVEAAAVLRGGQPGGERPGDGPSGGGEGGGVLLHRDLHPGNVLFSGPPDRPVVTGIVDWVETSWGPADADLAHCRTNLAMLHGPAAAEAFREAYADAGGRLDPDRRRGTWWDLDDALGFLPDPAEVAAPWRELGRTDLTAAVVRARLEAHVTACLCRA